MSTGEIAELVAKALIFILAAIVTVAFAFTIATVFVVVFMAVVIGGAIHHVCTA